MASSSHNISDFSCQEELNEICPGKSNSVCQSLSKSSSTLACSSPRGPHQKPEIHKSLNSIICVPKCNTSEWSPPQDVVPDLCRVRSDCNNLSVGYIQDKIPSKNMCRSADSSLATAADQEVPFNFVRCEVSENVSCLGHSETSMCTTETMDDLEKPVAFQKSYSDYFCNSRNSVREHNKNSAIYSSLSSSSCISVSACDETCTRSNATHDSGLGHSPSNAQNNLTDVMSSVGELGVSLCHLDNSTIQHNITVYTVPGTYHHGVLGPRNSGNGFPNNEHMFSQSHYSIPGIVCCNCVSDTRLLSSETIAHNNCSIQCNKCQEPTMKGDDTTSAYCHSVPIPSVQFAPGLVETLGEPVSGHLPPQCCTQLSLSDKFTFPKLVSSVSESGLDAKKLIKCGRLALPQPSVSSGQLNMQTSTFVQANTDLLLKTIETLPESLEITDSSAKLKDTWTMTSMNYFLKEYKIPLKDAEVQTTIIMENKAVCTSPCPQTTDHGHLFPEVGLALTLQSPQTPVREVRWDTEGMTWEVYGAAVDPEVLGLAIQKHLEIQIEQNLQPSELTGEVEQSAKEKRRSLRTVIQFLRPSNCCVRTSSTSD